MLRSDFACILARYILKTLKKTFLQSTSFAENINVFCKKGNQTNNPISCLLHGNTLYISINRLFIRNGNTINIIIYRHLLDIKRTYVMNNIRGYLLVTRCFPNSFGILYIFLLDELCCVIGVV